MDRKPNIDRGIGVISLMLCVLVFVLQANGVELNWVVSLVLYMLVAAGCMYSVLRHAVPHISPRMQILAALAVLIVVGGAGWWGTSKEYRREHPKNVATAPAKPEEPPPTVGTVQTPKPQTAQPPAKPQSPSTADAIPPPEARLLMSKASIIPLKNEGTGVRAFGVNFFYANRGSMPTTGQVHSETLSVSDHLLSREEIVHDMRDVSSFKALPKLRKGGDEIYPNDPNERFFTMPDEDDKIDQLIPFFDDVMNGKKRVYFFVAIRFRDASMKPSAVGVSETCGWVVLERP